MADDKSNTGAPDRDLINMEQDYEVRHWAETLGVDESALRDAVKAVGNSVSRVREHIAAAGR